VTYQTAQILVLEDDSIDAEAVRRAFQTAKVTNPVHFARDGIEGLTFLRGNGNAPLAWPCIVLLDLNMPRMDGIEFLKEVRRDTLLHRLIVFVLTTSQDEKDVLKAYDYNISGYVVKDNVGEDFTRLVAMLDSWGKVVELPSKD
jgi:CheY-like chemotaxis protein